MGPWNVAQIFMSENPMNEWKLGFTARIFSSQVDKLEDITSEMYGTA